MRTLRRSEFKPLLGQTFRVDAGESGPVPMELVEVNAAGGPIAAGTRDRSRTPFSLVFRAPASFRLPQQTFSIAHAELGSFPLFLVPIGPDERGMLYQAVFA